MEMNPKL